MSNWNQTVMTQFGTVFNAQYDWRGNFRCFEKSCLPPKKISQRKELFFVVSKCLVLPKTEGDYLVYRKKWFSNTYSIKGEGFCESLRRTFWYYTDMFLYWLVILLAFCSDRFLSIHQKSSLHYRWIHGEKINRWYNSRASELKIQLFQHNHFPTLSLLHIEGAWHMRFTNLNFEWNKNTIDAAAMPYFPSTAVRDNWSKMHQITLTKNQHIGKNTLLKYRKLTDNYNFVNFRAPGFQCDYKAK